MIKVAYIINSIKRGGPSNVILNLIQNLNQKEYDITLITLFNENDPYIVNGLKRNNINVIECRYTSRLNFIFSGGKEFEKLMVDGGYDVIHSHGFIPDIFSAKITLGVKKISTIHSIVFEDYLETYGWLKGKVYTFAHVHYLKRLDYCVCCSATVYKHMKDYLPNITYIRNGIDRQTKTCNITRKQLGIPENALVFIYVGRIEQGKNVVYLVNEFHRYHSPNEYLLLVGDGSETQQCQNLKDENIMVLGFQDEPINYMLISDIYTSASKSEGFSISVLEALDCGLALMLSDIPSHKEVFNIDKSVYLGETFSKENYYTQLEKMRANISNTNKDEIKTFKENYLSAKHMTDQYKEIYRKGYIREKGKYNSSSI